MGKKTSFIIIIALILGIGTGVGGTLVSQKYFFKNAPAKIKVQKDGPLVSIGELTANLQGGSFLRTAITIEGADAKSEELLKSKSAFLKDAVNVVLSHKTITDIKTPEGIEKLRQELLLKLNAVTDDQVVNVLFESFVYQ